ncbi:hypothetical protein AB0945_05725 [Streptomyces sp. NPDC005474]|uniref:hypothetical protein n=1 Tax=Streptomyces sp. NPDC005474 TaxID=3154878 RepID=UPI0034540E74
MHNSGGNDPHVCEITGEPSDDLLDHADANVGATNVAAQVFTADGEQFALGISTNRNFGDLTPNVQAAVMATQHHGGCGEIGALCDLEERGLPIGGARSQAVDVRGGSEGYDWDRHGVHREMCGYCRKLFTHLPGVNH